MKTSFITSTTVAVALFSATAAARTLTVKNNCAYTIWPGLYTDLKVSPSKPDHATGWQQDSKQTVSFAVPDDWRAGRIWGRRGCDFSKGTPGPTQCLDGGCNGGLECDPQSGTGVPPATVAEFTLGFNGQPDNYDVSLVDGFNIPMSITNNKGCHPASCNADLNPKCPPELTGPKDPSGQIVGCLSACAAGRGDPTNNPNCCTGTHNTSTTCPPDGVEFYHYFKDACTDSYAYAFDEQSGTALWTCDKNLAADYTVTFCP
ncbi:thaumatin-like protein [Polyporus arcularius HHB13444]|uniref:Thaumatin-like protein n=1 Tax=Polyporus arcularius HHB13444 TaxID=1314778 RepID=A0A5C3PWV5_9APHY|nr:thaumatin-like protein [Polyporus arcularius HHB13444]